MPQQWLSRTTAPGVPDGRRRLDLVVYGATERGETLHATLVSPVRSDVRPHAGAADRDGVALSTAERRKRTRYPELGQPGPQRSVVLAAEVGGRWYAAATAFVRQLARLRARRAPPAGVGAGGAFWLLQCRARFAAPSWAAGCRRLCLLEGNGRCSRMPSGWQSPAASPSAGDGACCGPPPLVRACRRGALLVVSLSRFTSSHPRAPYGRKRKKRKQKNKKKQVIHLDHRRPLHVDVPIGSSCGGRPCFYLSRTVRTKAKMEDVSYCVLLFRLPWALEALLLREAPAQFIVIAAVLCRSISLDGFLLWVYDWCGTGPTLW